MIVLNNRELIAQLQALPGTALVDATFGTGEAFTVTGAELLTLTDGREFVLINIFDGVPLGLVAG